MAMFHAHEWPCCEKQSGKCEHESWSSYFAQRAFIWILQRVPRSTGLWLIELRFYRSKS